MLQLILQRVDEYMRDRYGAGLAGDQYVCQDHAKGRVEASSLLVFDAQERQPLLVAKGTPLRNALVREGRIVNRIEFESLEWLQQIGMNRDRQTTPAPLGIWEEDGVLITLQSALSGRPLENIPARKHFSPDRIVCSVGQVIDWWKLLQDNFGVQRSKLEENLYRELVLEELKSFRKRFVIDPEEERLLCSRFEEAPSLLELELPLLVRHGDFCPANMVAEPAGIGVFDWEWPLRHHLPLLDLFHFFAALRYPFRGLRGESSHFASYVETFWGQSYFNVVLRDCLHDVCRQYEIPTGAVSDLFLVSLLQIANMKYEALIEYGLAKEPETAGAEGALWSAVGGADKDVPLAGIEQGVFKNLRHLAHNGFPPCLL